MRLTGCDLRCTYCDTEYAFYEGKRRTLDDIVAEVEKHPCRLVEITGGEPLLQKRVHRLMSRLCDDGWTMLIETSGAHDVGAIDPRVHRIMDLKCPTSGEMKRNRMENLELLGPRDEVKFVIGSDEDYQWGPGAGARRCTRLGRPRECNPLLPCFRKDHAAGIGDAGHGPMRCRASACSSRCTS